MTALRRAIAPLLGLGAALVLFVASRDLDRFARGGQLGPGFWPRLTLLGLGAACLAKVIVELRARPAAPAGGVAAPGPGASAPTTPATLTAAVLVILGYVLVTPVAGFPLATAGFIALFMWLCGARSPTALAASAGVGTVALLYVFVRLVYLPLPKGSGPFEVLTLALYRALRIF